MRLLVTARLSALNDPLTSWDVFSKHLTAKCDMIPIVEPYRFLNDEGLKPGSVGATIVPMTTLNSSFAVSTAPGISSFSDRRLPGTMLAMNYLGATEGPLWNAVRGAGYAYGFSLYCILGSGTLSYYVDRSPDAYKAIVASHETVGKIASGEIDIDKHILECAISQIVTMFAGQQSDMFSAARYRFSQAVIRDLPKDWANEVMRRVSNVSTDEMKSIIRETILPCFEPGRSNIVITCARKMQKDMKTSFREMGYRVQIRKLSNFYDDYDLRNLIQSPVARVSSKTWEGIKEFLTTLRKVVRDRTCSV